MSGRAASLSSRLNMKSHTRGRKMCQVLILKLLNVAIRHFIIDFLQTMGTGVPETER